jgi:TRADD-N domain-containing protein
VDPLTIGLLLPGIGALLAGLVSNSFRKRADIRDAETGESLIKTLDRAEAQAIELDLRRSEPADEERPMIEGAAAQANDDLIRFSTDTYRQLVKVALEDQKSAADQQRIYFVIGIVAAVFSFGVLLVGVYMLLVGNVAEGVLTTVSTVVPGFVTGVVYTQADKAERRRSRSAERAHRSLEDGLRLVRNFQMISQLSTVAERDHALRLIILQANFPDAQPAEIVALVKSGAYATGSA